MNYTYKLTTRGLCSELNSLLGFYESVIDEDCQIFIDASASQYFKSVSILDVFKFPSAFINSPHSDSTIISGNRWRKSAVIQHKTKLTTQQCAEFFSYTDTFKQKLNKNITKLSLPTKFNCFHIRRGDKVGEKLYEWTQKTGRTESKRFEFCDYLKHCKNIETIFIMTDDYRCIQEAREYINNNNLPHNILYLTQEPQGGHSETLNIQNDRRYSKQELVQFFSEIEIAKQSQQFIGTKSSNIFRYITNQCVKDVEFISLD